MIGLLAIAVLLAACMQEAVLEITRGGDQLTISVSKPGLETPPCVQGLSVTQAGVDAAQVAPLWQISTAEPGRCRASFIYGQVPAGFSESGRAPRLLTGSRYLVEVNGPGLLGGREFTFQAKNGSQTDS